LFVCIRFALFALALLLGAPAARAEPARPIELKDGMCFAVARAALPADEVERLAYRCGGRPDGYEGDWLWLQVDAADLARLPAEWRLLVDQTRFASMRLVTVHADGSVHDRRFVSGGAGDHWAVGGFLMFDARGDRARIVRAYLGIERLVSFDTMRKVRAVPEAAFDRGQILWVALASAFAGVVAASLVYTGFLYTGLRHGFLRRHALWCSAVLAYGLCWSNLVFYAVPWLAGAWGVRLNLWTAGLAALAATLFMAEFIEADALDRRLRRALVATGWATLAGSVAASLDFLGAVYAHAADRAANAAMALGTLAFLVCLIAALARGSRAARFYALAWSPTLAVFVVRGLRNFYLVPHADWMDMAMFGAAAFQVLLLSAAVSDRFRALQRDRDRATAESAEYSRLANVDALTGIENRRGFVARAEAMVARGGDRGVGLLLLDIDHFKAINDRYGHDAGDRVLAGIGRLLAADEDARTGVGRLGGEEFGVIAEGSCSELRARAERLRRRIAGLAFDFGAGSVRVTASIGVACPDRLPPFAELYRDADAALYRAKSAGRNRVAAAENAPRREAA